MKKIKEIEGLKEIIILTKKLNNIKRWSTEFMHKRTSVAEHSFAVTQIAQLLGIVEEEFGNTVDWVSLYRKALNHDLPEGLTGDIIHNVKRKTPSFNKMVEEIEKQIVKENVIDLIDNENIKNKYISIFENQKDDSLEGKILQAADIIDALLECEQEISLNNFYPFYQKKEVCIKNLQKIDLKSVDYFFTYILPSFKEI